MDASGYKRWHVTADIDSPCADLSYSYTGANAVSITMLFSRVTGRPDQDLVLWFRGVIAFRWTSDVSILLELSGILPKCSAEPWRGSAFPLLTVDQSQWLLSHASREPVEAVGRKHFVMITMNAVCEVLALPNVVAAWVNAADA